jgi:hypothetical protein
MMRGQTHDYKNQKITTNQVMKVYSSVSKFFCVSITAGSICALALSALASGKTTDTTTSTASGGGGSTTSGGGSTTSGGGTTSGGVNSNKPGTGTVAPAPTPIVSSNLTFSASGPINGVTPVGAGSYRIDPYYPTLSLMTVQVQASSVDFVDGSFLYVSVLTSNNLYGNSGGSISLLGGAGACTISAYVSPGTTILGVVISDVFGNPILVGN